MNIHSFHKNLLIVLLSIFKDLTSFLFVLYKFTLKNLKRLGS
nr:MAG TPA: hypothetical protein [Caudoviricetes sp.]